MMDRDECQLETNIRNNEPMPTSIDLISDMRSKGLSDRPLRFSALFERPIRSIDDYPTVTVVVTLTVLYEVKV